MKPLTPIALGPLRVTPICLGAMTAPWSAA